MPLSLSFIYTNFHPRYLTVLFLSLCIPFVYHSAHSYMSSICQTTATGKTADTIPKSMSVITTLSLTMAASAANSEQSGRMPVYFLGIGGPNFMEDTEHPAYSQLASVGQEITTKVHPKAIVVFSAHWQAGVDTLQINVAERTDLIYDFYGFPPHYYEYDYPNRGSVEVAEKVIAKLAAANFKVEPVERGLDHGVWAGFMVAFDPKKNPLDVPIVQVSLYDNEDIEKHYRVGQALESLRGEGVLIIGAGMAVHNLRDYRSTLTSRQTMPYAFTFDEALKEATTAKPEERQAKMLSLMKRSDARKAHPSLEHILPMYVSAGAAGSDIGEQLWTLPERSLSWAQYRFGEST